MILVWILIYNTKYMVQKKTALKNNEFCQGTYWNVLYFAPSFVIIYTFFINEVKQPRWQIKGTHLDTPLDIDVHSIKKMNF